MPRWARRDRGAVAALLIGVTLAQSAQAQAPSTNSSDGSDAATPRTVEVQILGGGLDDASLMETVREVLGRLGVAARSQIAPEGDGGMNGGSSNAMTATIDLTSPGEALVTVRNGRVQIRNAISRDASTSIVREEIADAVRSAIESQLFSDEVRARPTPPPVVPIEKPAPMIVEAPRPEAVEHALAVDLTTFAGAGPVSDSSGFVPHVGGGVVVGTRKGLKPSLSVTGSYVVSFGTTASGVDVTANIISLRATTSIEVLHASWIALAVGVGGGADIFSVYAAPARQIMPLSRTQVDPIVAGRAVAQASLTPGVAFTVIAGVDVDLASDQYVLEGGANSSVILSPWHFRPVVEAGFTFTAFGRGLFAARDTP